MWRGGGRVRLLCLTAPFVGRCRNRSNHNAVSTSRLSNGTGRIKASGSRTRASGFRPRKVTRTRQTDKAQPRRDIRRGTV